jgi:hypothetical protein
MERRDSFLLFIYIARPHPIDPTILLVETLLYFIDCFFIHDYPPADTRDGSRCQLCIPQKYIARKYYYFSGDVAIIEYISQPVT